MAEADRNHEVDGANRPYATFNVPHEELIPASELREDYQKLADVATQNPGVGYYVRYRHNGRTNYGRLHGSTIRELSSHYFDHPSETGREVSLFDVRLLAPIDPNRVSKVVGVAFNTINPDLSSVSPTAHPRWFAKLPTSLTGPGGGVEVPQEATQMIHEAEVVVVIGRVGRHVSVEDAPDYVWGVTAGNDFTEAEWMGESKGREAPPRLMAKGVDTFAAIGPAIAVGLDYRHGLNITHRVNGNVTQSGRSSDRLQSPAELVSYLSRYVTLLPGDLIFTGATPYLKDTPYRYIEPGQDLTIEIEGIGVLRNRAVPMGGHRWETMRGGTPA